MRYGLEIDGIMQRSTSNVIVCFDTSALNHLERDPDCDALAGGVLKTGSCLISAYNVLEATKTKDEQKRVALVTLMRRLANGTRPLDRPRTILRNVARAYATGTLTFHINGDPGLEAVWIALNQPESLDESARRSAIEWFAPAGRFDSIVLQKRGQLREVLETENDARPQTTAATMRWYFGDRDHLYARFSPRYHQETNQPLSRENFDELTHEPLCMLYFGAVMYGIYQRAFRKEGYSPKHHAGAVDLGQAIYLPFCDIFITADDAQYRALRLLNCYNTKRRTEVLRYAAFRRRLVELT